MLTTTMTFEKLEQRAIELNEELEYCSNEARIVGDDLDSFGCCPDWCSGSGKCGFCALEDEMDKIIEAGGRATAELLTIRRYQRKLEKLSSRGI